MRYLKYLFIIIIFLNGCKSIAYFNTPNDAFKCDAIVYMLDGTERKGYITVQFETGRDANKFITITNGSMEDKIFVDSLKCYKIKNDFYFPKVIELDFNGSQKLLFVKRLTKEYSRIALYELFQQRKETSDGTDQFMYFISLPAQNRLEVWNAGSKKFVPGFDEKMSKIVEDCSALATKIKAKTKGYFLPQLTFANQKKVAVFTTIIEEYNNCH